MDDRDLMRLRADTLFTYDERGRMVRDNDPEGRAAPRLFAGFTANGSVVRFSQAVSDDVAARIGKILARAEVDIKLSPPMVPATVRSILEQQSPIVAEESGPAYRFPDEIALPHDVVELTPANVTLAQETYPWLERELTLWHPCFAVVRDGAAVSVCFSSRIGSAVCEAGVETHPEYRGRGFASKVTAAWARAIRASGRTPLYSTTWKNLASQGVARRMRLIMYGSDVTWT